MDDDSLTLLLANSKARMALAKRMPQMQHLQPPPVQPAPQADAAEKGDDDETAAASGDDSCHITALREVLRKHEAAAAGAACGSLAGYADHVDSLLSGALATWVAAAAAAQKNGGGKVKSE